MDEKAYFTGHRFETDRNTCRPKTYVSFFRIWILNSRIKARLHCGGINFWFREINSDKIAVLEIEKTFMASMKFHLLIKAWICSFKFSFNQRFYKNFCYWAQSLTQHWLWAFNLKPYCSWFATSTFKFHWKVIIWDKLNAFGMHRAGTSDINYFQNWS